MALAEYTHLIDQPTHVFSHSSSWTDLIIESNPNVLGNTGVKLSLFDKRHHNLIFGELNFMISLPPTYNRQVWECIWWIYNECIWCSISSDDWNCVSQGTPVNQKVIIFNKHLMNIFHNFIPNKIIKCSYI